MSSSFTSITRLRCFSPSVSTLVAVLLAWPDFEVWSPPFNRRSFRKFLVVPAHTMPPLAAAVRPLPEEDVKLPGINAVLLGPPGSGKGTQVDEFFFMFLGNFNTETSQRFFFYSLLFLFYLFVLCRLQNCCKNFTHVTCPQATCCALKWPPVRN